MLIGKKDSWHKTDLLGYEMSWPVFIEFSIIEYTWSRMLCVNSVKMLR